MWDQRYGQPGFYYGREPNDFLVEQVTLHKLFAPGAEVLSLGEGEGRNAVYLAGLGMRVTGVDGSSVGLQKAQAFAAERGVTVDVVVADLAHYDLGVARWDGIVSLWCHLPSELRAPLYKAVVQALRPGGVLLLEAYTPKQLEYKTGGPSDPDMLLSVERARQELAGLEWVVAEEKLREVLEGANHNGMSSVVQLVGRKPA